jgi:hypothetical protein
MSKENSPFMRKVSGEREANRESAEHLIENLKILFALMSTINVHHKITFSCAVLGGFRHLA